MVKSLGYSPETIIVNWLYQYKIRSLKFGKNFFFLSYITAYYCRKKRREAGNKELSLKHLCRFPYYCTSMPHSLTRDME